MPTEYHKGRTNHLLKDIKFKTLQLFVLNTARLGNIARIEMLHIATSTLNPSTPQFFGVMKIIHRNIMVSVLSITYQ